MEVLRTALRRHFLGFFRNSLLILGGGEVEVGPWCQFVPQSVA